MDSSTHTLIVTWLGWACYIGGAAALAVYCLHFAKRQGWRRPWNAAGLFFTAIALSQIPRFLVLTSDGSGTTHAILAVLSLLVAVAAQSVMALRTRRRREGDDARA